ncbi:MAG: hypothetical protein ACLR4A_06700 [Christensenellales bacterium]
MKVRVGDADSGSLTGYMAADALTYTEDGIRTLLGRIIAYASKGAVKVMKECDENPVKSRGQNWDGREFWVIMTAGCMYARWMLRKRPDL